MKLNTGLTDAERAGAVAILTLLLADEYVLYTKTRNYHWNVTGPHFHDLHKLFESQYDFIDGKIDEIAEFIRSLGEKSPGSLREFLKSTRIKEDAGADVTASQMLHHLLADHEAVIRQLRLDVDKAGNKLHAADVADFLTGLLEEHQKTAWMLRATVS
jgi:starvation-inducible DNA-binding protein